MKINRIIMTCSLFLDVLILAAVFSFAWMTSNAAVEQRNIVMSLEYDDTTASYGVYKYDINQSIGRNADSEGNPYLISNIDINPYDLIFISRNRYTPVFARIEVKRHSSMPVYGTIYLTITRKAGNNDHSGSELSKYSSSIIRFTAKVDNKYDADPNVLYSNIDQTMYNDTKMYVTKENDTESHPYDAFSKTFVTAQKSGDEYTFTKTDSITLTMAYTADDWTVIDGTPTTLNIYLYMTYDEGLIDLYKKSSMISKIEIGTKNIIDFENDFDMIRVSYDG